MTVGKIGNDVFNILFRVLVTSVVAISLNNVKLIL